MSKHTLTAIVGAWAAIAAVQLDDGGLALPVVSGLIVAGAVIFTTWLALPYVRCFVLRRWGLNIEVLNTELTEENTTSVEVVLSGRRFLAPVTVDVTVDKVNFCCLPTWSIAPDAPRYDRDTVHTRGAVFLGRRDTPTQPYTTDTDKYNGMTVTLEEPLTLSADTRERFQAVIEAPGTVNGYFSIMAYSDDPNRVRGRLLADEVLETSTERPKLRTRLGLPPT